MKMYRVTHWLYNTTKEKTYFTVARNSTHASNVVVRELSNTKDWALGWEIKSIKAWTNKTGFAILMREQG